MSIDKIKKIGLVIAAILVALYVTFLFIVPNVINLNSYKTEIKKLALDYGKLDVDYDSAKIVTSPKLSAGVRVSGIKINLTDGSKLFSADSASVKVSLLPLLFKTIKVDSISVTSPVVNVDIIDSNKFKLEDYIADITASQQKDKPEKAEVTAVNFSLKFPSVKITDYKILFNDIKTSDVLKISGEEIRLVNGELNKKVKVITQGSVSINDKENISYNLNIDTFLPDLSQKKDVELKNQDIPFVNPVQAFKEYDLKTNVSTRIKIRENKNGLFIKGFCNVDKFSLKLADKVIPSSFIKLEFAGHKVDINSNMYVDPVEKALIKGDIAFGNKKIINLTVKAEKLSVENIQEILKGLLDSLHIPNELGNIVSKGYIQSDFSINTNLKKIQSQGYLKVSNVSVVHKTIPAYIKNTNADIDFSGNKIVINNCKSYLNDTLFEVVGSVSQDSVADIKVFTQSLPITKLYKAFAPKDIKSLVDINNGLLTLNLKINGRLDKIKPQIFLDLKSLNMHEKSTNSYISNKNLLTQIVSDGKGYNGNITLTDTIVSIPASNVKIKNAKTIVKFDDKNITVIPSNIDLNSSKLSFSGTIKNYVSKPEFDIEGSGKLSSYGLLTMIPKEYRSIVSYAGNLPVAMNIKGTPEKISLYAQIQANGQDHFSPITINKLFGRTSLINVAIDLANNELNIKDLGIYELQYNKELSPNFTANLSNSYKIAQITGGISGLNKKVQSIDSIKFHLPASLSLSTQLVKNSRFDVKGDLNITGTTSKPVMRGNMSISNLSLPQYMTKAQSISILLDDSDLNVKVDSLNLNDSIFNIDADAKLDFSSVLKIHKLNLTSSFVDADKLIKVAEKISQPPSGASSALVTSAPQDLPIKIESGTARIAKLKSGNVIISDIVSNYSLHKNILTMPNFSAKAYGGDVSGKITYNVITTEVGANLEGKNVDANPAITAAVLLKDQVMGTASFKTNVKFKGATYEEQMNTLTGTANFEVKNGQLGSLGRFETFLKANNLLSQTFISTTLGSIINTIAPYNTGEFKTLSGNVILSDGVATLAPVTSEGKNMSLYIIGGYNILQNTVNMEILGRISSNVSGALGPLANLTTDKIAKYIPTAGIAVLNIFKNITDVGSRTEFTKIPALNPVSENTQEFRVVLNGNIINPALCVRSFKWLSTQAEVDKAQVSIKDLIKLPENASLTNILQQAANSINQNSSTTVPQIKSKDEILKQIQQTPQVQEKIDKIQSNETVQKIQKFSNILKQQYVEDSKTNNNN